MKTGIGSHHKTGSPARHTVRQTLHFRINLLFFLLMLSLSIIIVVVVQTIGKASMVKENYRFIDQKGQTIITRLGQYTSYVEAKAKALANMALIIPRDNQRYRRAVYDIIYRKESSFRIAGGGVWPEPYAFDPDIERKSFFWGHNQNNQPLFFDDYNNPGGPGYHHEEWYVPARFLDPSGAYWSRSYVDPYSSEPMVTCTVPIVEKGQFWGAGTIDLKLNHLQTFLHREAAALNGYIFAVDRNNTFLSFPDADMIKVLTPYGSKAGKWKYLSARQLAGKHAQFAPVVEVLEHISQRAVYRKDATFPDRAELAEQISSMSREVTLLEAQRIAASIRARSSLEDLHGIAQTNNKEGQENEGGGLNIHPIILEKDFILNQKSAAFVFLMPGTDWKVVIVVPFSRITGVSDTISLQILACLSLGMMICVLIAYLYIRSALVLPLKVMTRQLMKTTEPGMAQHIALPESHQNELGDLAFWFNRRAEALEASENLTGTLFAIANAVNTTLNLDELYKQVHTLLGSVLDVTNFYIATVSEDKRTLFFPYFVDTVDQRIEKLDNFNPDHSITGFVVSNRRAILLDERALKDYSHQGRTKGALPLVWMGAPLIVREEVIGVIAVQSYTHADLYTEQDLQVLSAISDQVAIAIDRKQKEDELRSREQRYRHLFNHAPAGMYEIDFVNRKFTEVNAVLCQYLGYTEKELLSMDPVELLTEESKEAFMDGYRRVMRGERISDEVEYNVIAKNGSTLCVLLNTDFVYEGSRLLRAHVVAHNITERKKIEEMIIQSEKMMSVGGLAAGMAHEINNPLAGMMQNAQVIQNRLTRTMAQNETAAAACGTSMASIKKFMEKRGILELLQSIHDAGSRAAKIIENMLSFARKGDSEKQQTRLDELIDKTIDLAQSDYDLKRSYDFRKIKILKVYAADLPKVMCEASKIQQVIFNIIKNASEALAQVKNSVKAPCITFRLFKEGHMACIEIEDNGPGIDYDTKKRVFEPFYTTKSVDKGTGLGLSVSYFIVVDEHKGLLEVESAAGQGTVFKIKLPIFTVENNRTG